MFVLNSDDLSIYATRGDIVFFTVSAEDKGEVYTFKAGDVVRMKIFGKKDAENVVLEKDFPVTEDTENVEILLTAEDTKIGEVISKPRDYWYEIELNPLTNPQTIIGYDEDGPKVFKLFPEGADIPAFVPTPEDIPFIDSELDLASPRPVENQAVAREIVQLKAAFDKTNSKSDDTAASLAMEKARIDNFIKGGAVADGETLDMRVDAMGHIHKTAGAAIRAEDTVQNGILDSMLNSVYLPVEYGETAGYGFGTNGNNEAILIANNNAVLRHGIIEKPGYYNLTGPLVVTASELNDTSYLPFDLFVEYGANRTNAYIEAGSHFYVFGTGLVPQRRVSYLPENIVISVSPDEKEMTITEADEVTYTEIAGLLESGLFRINTERYGLYCYPVQKGISYRLQSEFFDFPMAAYQLFGFVESIKYETHGAYIEGGVNTNDGKIDIILKSPIDGYLLVSNDTNRPSKFTLKKVSSISLVSNIDRSIIAGGQPYKKLLTIGDSLSGNLNLWQPTAIELLGMDEYGILGGAGLTVADQGKDVNTIYNRVMDMEFDEDVDIITFWGGYNDFSSARVLSSLKEQLDKSKRDATTFYGGVLDCVEKILSTYPLKQVVMIGTTPFNVNGSWTVKTNPKGLKITDYVNAFREVAEYYSIPFLDLLHNSGFNDYNYSTYYLDQGYRLHPNTEGHKVVGRKVAGFIKSLDGRY